MQALFYGTGVNQIVQESINRKSGDSPYAGLAGDVLPVRDDSIDGNVVKVSYFLVEHTLGDAYQDFLLTRGQFMAVRLRQLLMR